VRGWRLPTIARGTFLGPWHDRTQVLRYVGVRAYVFNVQLKYGPDDPDVLAHEFRVEEGLLVHEIVFSNRRGIITTCEHVLIRTEMHAPGSDSRN
jgi:hypothetical protein